MSQPIYAIYFDSHSRTVWGVIWLIVACIYFALGIVVGLVAFKVTAFDPFFWTAHTNPSTFQESAAQQQDDSRHFLPAPGR